MKRLMIVLVCLVMAGMVGAASVTFNTASGMVDNSMDKATPTTNLGIYNLIWITAISDSTDRRGHIGDPTMDEVLTALGTITGDSAYLVYTRDRVYYSMSDSIFMWPVQIIGSRDWSETQETWTQWKTGSNWSTPGGDTMVAIAKVDTLTTHTDDIQDTIVIRRGVLGGTDWLDSCKTSTGNTGILLVARQNQIGTDAKVGRVEIMSTEWTVNEAQRPYIVYFYTSGAPAVVTKQVGAAKLGSGKW